MLVSDAVESAALGAVMLGIDAMNLEPFERKKNLSFYQPNILNNEVYIKCFNKFERIYRSLKDEWNNETIALLQVPV